MHQDFFICVKKWTLIYLNQTRFLFFDRTILFFNLCNCIFKLLYTFFLEVKFLTDLQSGCYRISFVASPNCDPGVSSVEYYFHCCAQVSATFLGFTLEVPTIRSEKFFTNYVCTLCDRSKNLVTN